MAVFTISKRWARVFCGIFIYDHPPAPRTAEGSIWEGYWQRSTGSCGSDDEGFVAVNRLCRLNFPSGTRMPILPSRNLPTMNRRELKHTAFAGSGSTHPRPVRYHQASPCPWPASLFALLAAPRHWSSGRFFGITASLIVVFAYYVLTALAAPGIKPLPPPPLVGAERRFGGPGGLPSLAGRPHLAHELTRGSPLRRAELT